MSIDTIKKLSDLQARIPIGADIEWRRDVEDILLNLSDPTLLNKFTVINYTGDPATRAEKNRKFIEGLIYQLKRSVNTNTKDFPNPDPRWVPVDSPFLFLQVHNPTGIIDLESGTWHLEKIRPQGVRILERLWRLQLQRQNSKRKDPSMSVDEMAEVYHGTKGSIQARMTEIKKLRTLMGEPLVVKVSPGRYMFNGNLICETIINQKSYQTPRVFESDTKKTTNI